MNLAIKDNKRKHLVLLAMLLVFQVIIYAPQVGTGFVTDDFVWLDNTVVNGQVDFLKPFTETTGFFRPMVNLTIGIQYYVHGLNPLPYGWLNLLLHLANILLVYLVLDSVEISRPYALWAAALFAVNAKGPTMAVGWISGRTTLLFSFFMLLSLYFYLKVRLHGSEKAGTYKRIMQYTGIGMIYFAALLSKETAAALPIFVFLAAAITEKEGLEQRWRGFFKNTRTALLNTLVFLVPLAVYLVLRMNSNAMTPLNAPAFYRYSYSPLTLFGNLAEYIIRSGLWEIAVILWLIILLIFMRRETGGRERIDGRVLVAGSGWFLCFLLPTVLIPARSDIYVYVPQVGIHVVALAVIFYLWKRTGISHYEKRNRVAVLVPVVILAAAAIVHLVLATAAYSKRGHSAAEFTREVRRLFLPLLPLKTGERIFIIDMEAGRGASPGRTVAYGFAPLLNVFFPGRELRGEIIPPGKVSGLTCDTLPPLFFVWGQGKLIGPLNCRDMETAFYFLCPGQTFLIKIEEWSKKWKYRRFYRLKKRQEWKRKLQEELKEREKEKKAADRTLN